MANVFPSRNYNKILISLKNTFSDLILGIEQVIEPIIDPYFSEKSVGFRKGRNAY
jgi:retron-type reverse transcriptase